MSSSIPENLEKVRQLIALYKQKYARIDTPVQLIAVSKTHGADKVRLAWHADQRHFAENYLQEALDKMEALADLDITWHYIGPIQSNKTRAIAERFHWVHSVDRIKVARRLGEQRPASLPPLNILLQVNISGEASKSGVAPEDLPALAREAAGVPGLALAGLMAIPAPVHDFAAQRESFRRLRELRDDLLAAGLGQCRELSMGMSGDFEAAIAEGATMIRIGTDIFGPRE